MQQPDLEGAQEGESRTALLRKTCDLCTKRKRRCWGPAPCRRCQYKGVPCVFSVCGKRGPKSKDARDADTDAPPPLRPPRLAAKPATSEPASGTKYAAVPPQQRQEQQRQQRQQHQRQQRQSQVQQRRSASEPAQLQQVAQQQQRQHQQQYFAPPALPVSPTAPAGGLLLMCRQQSSETWTLSLGSARPLAEAVAAPAAALNAGLRIPAASDGDQMESQEHAVDFHSAQAAAEGDRDSRASPVQQRGRWRLGRRRRRGAAAEAAEAAEGALTALPVHATGTSAPAAAAAPWELEAAAYRNVLPASAVNDADTAVQRQQREHSLQWRRRQQRRQAAAAAAADATPPFEAYGDAQLRGDGGSGGDSGGGGGDGFDSSSSGGEDGGSGGDASDAIAQLHALPLFESWRDDDAAAMSDSSALPRSSSASSFDALLNSGSDDDLLEELSSGGGSRRGSGAATPGLEVEEGGCDAPQQEVAIEDDYDAEIDESILAVLAAELSDDTLAEMADACMEERAAAGAFATCIPQPPQQQQQQRNLQQQQQQHWQLQHHQHSQQQQERCDQQPFQQQQEQQLQRQSSSEWYLQWLGIDSLHQNHTAQPELQSPPLPLPQHGQQHPMRAPPDAASLQHSPHKAPPSLQTPTAPSPPPQQQQWRRQQQQQLWQQAQHLQQQRRCRQQAPLDSPPAHTPQVAMQQSPAMQSLRQQWDGAAAAASAFCSQHMANLWPTNHPHVVSHGEGAAASAPPVPLSDRHPTPSYVHDTPAQMEGQWPLGRGWFPVDDSAHRCSPVGDICYSSHRDAAGLADSRKTG